VLKNLKNQTKNFVLILVVILLALLQPRYILMLIQISLCKDIYIFIGRYLYVYLHEYLYTHVDGCIDLSTKQFSN